MSPVGFVSSSGGRLVTAASTGDPSILNAASRLPCHRDDRLSRVVPRLGGKTVSEVVRRASGGGLACEVEPSAPTGRDVAALAVLLCPSSQWNSGNLEPPVLGAGIATRAKLWSRESKPGSSNGGRG